MFVLHFSSHSCVSSLQHLLLFVSSLPLSIPIMAAAFQLLPVEVGTCSEVPSDDRCSPNHRSMPLSLATSQMLTSVASHSSATPLTPRSTVTVLPCGGRSSRTLSTFTLESPMTSSRPCTNFGRDGSEMVRLSRQAEHGKNNNVSRSFAASSQRLSQVQLVDTPVQRAQTT